MKFETSWRQADSPTRSGFRVIQSIEIDLIIFDYWIEGVTGMTMDGSHVIGIEWIGAFETEVVEGSCLDELESGQVGWATIGWDSYGNDSRSCGLLLLRRCGSVILSGRDILV